MNAMRASRQFGRAVDDDFFSRRQAKYTDIERKACRAYVSIYKFRAKMITGNDGH